MRTIDTHAHLIPQCCWKTFDQGEEWYGYRYEPGGQAGFFITRRGREPLPTPKLRFTA